MCIRCGSFVCERCFDGYMELCSVCSPASPKITYGGRNHSSGISSSGLRMLGMLLVVFGLLITSMALLPVEGEGFIFIFPFVFGNVGGQTAAILSIIFMGLFLASSLLPWLLAYRGRRAWEGFTPFRHEGGPRESEEMEYIITLEIPGPLKRKVYIEGDGDEVHLNSTADPTFHRTYKLPEGFQLDDYTYEYDGEYLLLKLKLTRST